MIRGQSQRWNKLRRKLKLTKKFSQQYEEQKDFQDKKIHEFRCD